MNSVFAGGSWHAAPPESRDLEIEAEMYHFRCEGPVCHFCGSDAREEAWDISTIVDHDTEIRLRCPCCYNSDCGGLACPCAATPWHVQLQHHQYDQPEQERRGEQIEGQQCVWREPRQPSSLPPRIASSSTSQLPLQTIKVEPVVEGASNDGNEGGGGYGSEITLPSGNDPQASIVVPRNALHEVKKDNELSEASSRDDYERAGIERDRINSWRTDTFEQVDLGFEYVFADFKQAHLHAGRAVAVTRGSARLLAEPELVTDKVSVSAIEAIATKIREFNLKDREAVDKKKVERAPFLRQPGEEAKAEEAEEDKVQFIETLARQMMDCKIGHLGTASTADLEIMSSSKHRVASFGVASNELTLHKATTAADEVKMYCERKETHMEVGYVKPTVLEELFWQSSQRHHMEVQESAAGVANVQGRETGQ